MATHPIQGQDPENPVNTKRTIPSGSGLPAFWSNDMDRALAYLEVHQCEYEKMVPELKTWFPQLTNVSFPLFCWSRQVFNTIRQCFPLTLTRRTDRHCWS